MYVVSLRQSALPRMAHLFRGLGIKMVHFYIGTNYEEFAVHHKRLREHSQLFKNAFDLLNNEFFPFLQRTLGPKTSLSPQNRGICLVTSKDNPQGMETLVEYLYSPSLPENMTFKAIMSLYRLADRFAIPGLLNKLMDYIRESHKVSGKEFRPKQVKYIFNHRSNGDGKLWKYCAAQVLGNLM